MDSMSLSGRMVLHYQVLEKVGEGGMGVVYKAQDTHLDRLVALKFLPREKTADPERRRRFIQEAKAASSLQHPNIIVVHDIASDGGLDVIVMEFVEGATLDERIGRKGLGLSEALGLAVQIADGLARAHSAGIIHRDLKPGNIMVTPDGRVKILDFGLAKLLEDGPSDSVLLTATMGRPDRPKTAEGHILGTVAYMSPEQAEGKNLDARSDIFSFGAVLYEMIAGRPAFRRESQVATLAAIISEEPKPIAAAGDIMPPEITQLLARCLRKDPQRRWQTMSDLKVLLQDLKEDSESGKLRAPASAHGSRRRSSPLIWLLPAAAVIAAILLWLFLPKKAEPEQFAITRLTFDDGISWEASVSSDGRMMAFASDRSGEGHSDIWIQQLAGGAPLRLTDHPSDDLAPAISPDGTRVVFRSERDGGGLFEADALGGNPRRLTDGGHLPRYSPGGDWISYIQIPPSLDLSLVKMYLLPARGGEPVPFQPDFRVIGVSANSAPVWSPDGTHLIFSGRRDDDPQSFDWWVAPAAGGPAVRMNARQTLRLVPGWESPYVWDDTHIYFATGSTVEGVNISRVPIDRKRWVFSGPAEPVTSGPGVQYPAGILPDGRLVYFNLNWTAQIWMLAGEPDAGAFEGNPVLLTRDATAKFSPGLSRDGRRLVFSSLGGMKVPRIEVRAKDLSGGGETAYLMTAGRTGQSPVISPDGKTIAYRDIRDGAFRTFLLTGNESRGKETCDSCRIIGFFSDARFALVWDGGRELIRLDTASGERTPLLKSSAGRIADAAMSPDDRWIAVVLQKPDGKTVLAIAPMSDPPAAEAEWISIYNENAYLGSPTWSPNGERLYYLSNRDGFVCIWSQKLDPISKKPSGEARAVYHAHRNQFQLNFPLGNGTVSAAADKLVFWAGQATGNIYLAAPSKK